MRFNALANGLDIFKPLRTATIAKKPSGNGHRARRRRAAYYIEKELQ